MKGPAASLFFTPFFFMIMSENPLPRPLLGRFTPKNGVPGALLGLFTPKNGVSGALLHGFTPKFRVLAPILNVAILAICLTACGGQARIDKEDLAAREAARHYADSAVWQTIDRPDFSIRYPSDWTLQPESENAVFYLYAPAESDGDRFRENVSLVVEVLPSGKYDADSYVEEAVKLLQGQVTANERVVRAGHEARRLVYTQRPALDVVTTNELYVWVINGKAYLLAFSRESGNEGDQADTGERILQTFEFR
ncbi:hypothetical protein N425_12885 [Tannerella sp. oral taxon BU063 isolate Cell 2]|uniref:PsbP C-terminal domain-containing protein n=1 Tax=Tannerella sp. oral taxon BU063 isolate Cell 2 TaxID=1411148 RepID=W2C0Z0_9BACT|nr:hypothetical protein N425_12885 [Tannerella sp. oral taxon BU063 isolate Cell 2]